MSGGDLSSLTAAFCVRCLGWPGMTWMNGEAWPVEVNGKIGSRDGHFRPTVTHELLARVLEYRWHVGQRLGRPAAERLVDRLTAIVRAGLNLEYRGYGFNLAMLAACVEAAGEIQGDDR